ncbi:MAG: hypothetical protein JW757_06420 [Anaerolineales bacterium]|nr:hypothetical protein [Anaerolineales bacterium]
MSKTKKEDPPTPRMIEMITGDTDGSCPSEKAVAEPPGDPVASQPKDWQKGDSPYHHRDIF